MPASSNERLSLLAQWREDWIAHQKDWFNPGFRAIVVHRFGNWRMTIRPKLLRAPFSVLYRMMYRRILRSYGIELSYSTVVGRRTAFHHQGGIVINGACVIGDDCVIRHGVTMGIRYEDRLTEVPTVGNGVSIGVGAILLGGIHVGDGAKIGANSLVLCDVPPGASAIGSPARIVFS